MIHRTLSTRSSLYPSRRHEEKVCFRARLATLFEDNIQRSTEMKGALKRGVKNEAVREGKCAFAYSPARR